MWRKTFKIILVLLRLLALYLVRMMPWILALCLVLVWIPLVQVAIERGGWLMLGGGALGVTVIIVSIALGYMLRDAVEDLVD